MTDTHSNQRRDWRRFRQNNRKTAKQIILDTVASLALSKNHRAEMLLLALTHPNRDVRRTARFFGCSLFGEFFNFLPEHGNVAEMVFDTYVVKLTDLSAFLSPPIEPAMTEAPAEIKKPRKRSAAATTTEGAEPKKPRTRRTTVTEAIA